MAAILALQPLKGTPQPQGVIYVDIPYYQGELEVMVLDTLICDLVLGNMKEISDVPDENWQCGSVDAAVITRAEANNPRQTNEAVNRSSCK